MRGDFSLCGVTVVSPSRIAAASASRATRPKYSIPILRMTNHAGMTEIPHKPKLMADDPTVPRLSMALVPYATA
jgi:hypothetical protein